MDYKDPEYHKQKSRDHYKKYKKQYDARNKLQRDVTRKMLNKIKSAGCTRCSEKDVRCIDFHHIKGKDKKLSSMWGWNQERVLHEVAKCILLCANCHRKEHISKEFIAVL